jgi:hypothetical protein
MITRDEDAVGDNCIFVQGIPSYSSFCTFCLFSFFKRRKRDKKSMSTNTDAVKSTLDDGPKSVTIAKHFRMTDPSSKPSQKSILADTLSSIKNAFSPEAWEQRETARFDRFEHNQQINTLREALQLSQKNVRHIQKQNDRLIEQNTKLRERVNKAEWKLDVLNSFPSFLGQNNTTPPTQAPGWLLDMAMAKAARISSTLPNWRTKTPDQDVIDLLSSSPIRDPTTPEKWEVTPGPRQLSPPPPVKRDSTFSPPPIFPPDLKQNQNADAAGPGPTSLANKAAALAAANASVDS